MLTSASSLQRRPRVCRKIVGRGRRRLGESGVAAIEFAIVFPVALLLYVGAVELSQAVTTSRKVEALSRTLVDLLSQQGTASQPTSTPPPPGSITAAALQTLFTASTGLLYPASTVPLKMTVSAVDITNNSNGYCCQANVRWTYTQGGTLRPCNTKLNPVDPSAPPSPSTIPNSLMPYTLYPPVQQLPQGTSLSVLIADVSYVYQPIFNSSFISFASGMSRTSYMYPRSPGQVIAANPSGQTGPIQPPNGSPTQSGTICY